MIQPDAMSSAILKGSLRDIAGKKLFYYKFYENGRSEFQFNQKVIQLVATSSAMLKGSLRDIAGKKNLNLACGW